VHPDIPEPGALPPIDASERHLYFRMGTRTVTGVVCCCRVYRDEGQSWAME